MKDLLHYPHVLTNAVLNAFYALFLPCAQIFCIAFAFILVFAGNQGAWLHSEFISLSTAPSVPSTDKCISFPSFDCITPIFVSVLQSG